MSSNRLFDTEVQATDVAEKLLKKKGALKSLYAKSLHRKKDGDDQLLRALGQLQLARELCEIDIGIQRTQIAAMISPIIDAHTTIKALKKIPRIEGDRRAEIIIHKLVDPFMLHPPILLDPLRHECFESARALDAIYHRKEKIALTIIEIKRVLEIHEENISSLFDEPPALTRQYRRTV